MRGAKKEGKEKKKRGEGKKREGGGVEEGERKTRQSVKCRPPASKRAGIIAVGIVIAKKRKKGGKRETGKGKREREEKGLFLPPPLSRNDNNQNQTKSKVGSAAASVKSGRKCVNPHWLVPWLFTGPNKTGATTGKLVISRARNVWFRCCCWREKREEEEVERERGRERKREKKEEERPKAAGGSKGGELLPMLSILPFSLLSSHSRRLPSTFLVTHRRAVKRTRTL